MALHIFSTNQASYEDAYQNTHPHRDVWLVALGIKSALSVPEERLVMRKRQFELRQVKNINKFINLPGENQALNIMRLNHNSLN